MRVIVVGAGVIGLTCAVRLAEDGHDVHVLARDLPLETTSAVAAAWWYPYLAMPYERVGRWAARSLEVLTSLADEVDHVRMARSHEVLRRRTPDPWWAATVPDLERITDPPAGWVDGWSFTAPVIEMEHHLPWLVARLEASGGTLTRGVVSALPRSPELVVNATGLANRMLCDDDTVEPVRGQTVVVEPCGVDDVWLSDDAEGGPIYVVPRRHDVVVGGTEQRGSWAVRPDPATADDILERAARLVPQVRGARVLGHRVGLRPARPSVRLELEERRDGCPVVHCYGHGGAGVTLSWGCADEVAALAGGLLPLGAA